MSTADEIEKLHSLKERGIISPSEFEARKAEALRGTPASPAPQPTPAIAAAAAPADKRGWLRKWAVRIIVIWFCLGLLVMCITGGRGLKQPDSAELTSPRHHIGEAVKSGPYEIDVKGAQTGKVVGNEFFNEKAGDGATFVVVTWTLKNISERGIVGARLPTDAYLYDGNNRQYSIDVAATIAFLTAAEIDSKVISDLNPGVSITDAAVFEVSAKDFNPSTWKVAVEGDDDVVFALLPRVQGAQSAPGAQSNQSSGGNNASTSRYGYLLGRTANEILAIDEVQGRIADLVSVSEFGDLARRLETSSPSKLRGGWIFASGLMPHQGGTNEAAIAIHQDTGQTFAAMLIAGNKLDFFGASAAEDLPPPLNEWLQLHQRELDQRR